MITNVVELSSLARNRALNLGAGIKPAIFSVLDEHAELNDAPLENEEQIRTEIEQRLTGYAFLQPFLDDETIEEIWINQPGEIRWARGGENSFSQVDFTETELRTQVERLIRHSGRRLDRATPFIDAQLSNGYRFHAVIPDITREHLSLNIRKFSKQMLTIADLVSRQVLTSTQANYLVERLKMGENVLISGATQAGKTTLLSALISALDSGERVISVEDTFELRCSLPDWVALQTRPASTEGRHEVDLRRLVRETLRMRPTRLVVGEVRGAEALDMLIAMNSGIPGLCTIHANSAEEALKKLRTLPLLAGGNISGEFLQQLISGTLNIFVHCHRDRLGNRSVVSIKRIGDSSDLRMLEVFP